MSARIVAGTDWWWKSRSDETWNRRFIDHVQITVAETVGVEGRGGYYDRSGALRDMVQNHLLQILCLIAMEPPVSFNADEVRNKKVDFLRTIRPIRHEDVNKVAVRGQNGKGVIDCRSVTGYREEPGVAPDSATETFVALKLMIDNWRWQGVPFFLRSGKRLHSKVSEVSIFFRPVPHQLFPHSAVENWQPNRLVIRIQPEGGNNHPYPGETAGHLLHARLGEYAVQLPRSLRQQFSRGIRDSPSRCNARRRDTLHAVRPG